ncbi:hypothetical protein [Thalassotalea mangrovi]|uniref:Uncharacterized protein n=1 Tax=Thalassotalea mangrovi TaxID=2572245 RepID=A0A4U1B5C3_9GAMM|nr:hypothetical protein [Thalassotalea mangrovi]TKB44868.1 hypothetical protein E8M12_10195 [Thalassotalea mangrovi]
MAKLGLVSLMLVSSITYAQQASESVPVADHAQVSEMPVSQPSWQCPGIETLTNQDQPSVIYNRVVRCVEMQEYHRAAELMFIAMSFGKFDSMRVSGEIRHHAIARTRIRALNKLDALQLDLLRQSLVLKFRNHDERQFLCSSLRGIGRPTYQPDYMVNYENPLSSRQLHLQIPSEELPAFEQEMAWENVYFNFARCRT